VIGDGTIPAV